MTYLSSPELILYSLLMATVVVLLGLMLKDSKDGYCLMNKSFYMASRFFFALASAAQTVSDELTHTSKKTASSFVEAWKLADREAE